MVVVAVGLFAVGEALYMASRPDLRAAEIIPIKGSLFMTREEWRRSWKPWLRGSAIGFPFGALPAGGTEIPTFLSYFTEKKLSKHPEEFGKGAIEGVAGPEAANNAAVAGVLVPLLTLGLPTSATAAILLAAFEQYNLKPGPLLFAGSSTLVWGLIASLYIGNLMLLVLNLPLAGLWVRLLSIPQPLLYGGILLFSTLGVYALNNSTFDLILLFIVGVLGFLMRRYEFSRGALHHRPHSRQACGSAIPPRDEYQPGRSFGVRHASDLGGAAADRADRACRADHLSLENIIGNAEGRWITAGPASRGNGDHLRAIKSIFPAQHHCAAKAHRPSSGGNRNSAVRRC